VVLDEKKKTVNDWLILDQVVVCYDSGKIKD
jgi:hypothetical protein